MSKKVFRIIQSIFLCLLAYGYVDGQQTRCRSQCTARPQFGRRRDILSLCQRNCPRSCRSSLCVCSCANQRQSSRSEITPNSTSSTFTDRNGLIQPRGTELSTSSRVRLSDARRASSMTGRLQQRRFGNSNRPVRPPITNIALVNSGRRTMAVPATSAPRQLNQQNRILTARNGLFNGIRRLSSSSSRIRGRVSGFSSRIRGRNVPLERIPSSNSVNNQSPAVQNIGRGNQVMETRQNGELTRPKLYNTIRNDQTRHVTKSGMINEQKIQNMSPEVRKYQSTNTRESVLPLHTSHINHKWPEEEAKQAVRPHIFPQILSSQSNKKVVVSDVLNRPPANRNEHTSKQYGAFSKISGTRGTPSLVNEQIHHPIRHTRSPVIPNRAFQLNANSQLSSVTSVPLKPGDQLSLRPEITIAQTISNDQVAPMATQTSQKNRKAPTEKVHYVISPQRVYTDRHLPPSTKHSPFSGNETQPAISTVEQSQKSEPNVPSGPNVVMSLIPKRVSSPLGSETNSEGVSGIKFIADIVIENESAKLDRERESKQSSRAFPYNQRKSQTELQNKPIEVTKLPITSTQPPDSTTAGYFTMASQCSLNSANLRCIPRSGFKPHVADWCLTQCRANNCVVTKYICECSCSKPETTTTTTPVDTLKQTTPAATRGEPRNHLNQNSLIQMLQSVIVKSSLEKIAQFFTTAQPTKTTTETTTFATTIPQTRQPNKKLLLLQKLLANMPAILQAIPTTTTTPAEMPVTSPTTIVTMRNNNTNRLEKWMNALKKIKGQISNSNMGARIISSTPVSTTTSATTTTRSTTTTTTPTTTEDYSSIIRGQNQMGQSPFGTLQSLQQLLRNVKQLTTLMNEQSKISPSSHSYPHTVNGPILPFFNDIVLPLSNKIEKLLKQQTFSPDRLFANHNITAQTLKESISVTESLVKSKIPLASKRTANFILILNKFSKALLCSLRLSTDLCSNQTESRSTTRSTLSTTEGVGNLHLVTDISPERVTPSSLTQMPFHVNNNHMRNNTFAENTTRSLKEATPVINLSSTKSDATVASLPSVNTTASISIPAAGSSVGGHFPQATQMHGLMLSPTSTESTTKNQHRTHTSSLRHKFTSPTTTEMPSTRIQSSTREQSTIRRKTWPPSTTTSPRDNNLGFYQTTAHLQPNNAQGQDIMYTDSTMTTTQNRSEINYVTTTPETAHTSIERMTFPSTIFPALPSVDTIRNSELIYSDVQRLLNSTLGIMSSLGVRHVSDTGALTQTATTHTELTTMSRVVTTDPNIVSKQILIDSLLSNYRSGSSTVTLHPSVLNLLFDGTLTIKNGLPTLIKLGDIRTKKGVPLRYFQIYGNQDDSVTLNSEIIQQIVEILAPGTIMPETIAAQTTKQQHTTPSNSILSSKKNPFSNLPSIGSPDPVIEATFNQLLGQIITDNLADPADIPPLTFDGQSEGADVLLMQSMVSNFPSMFLQHPTVRTTTIAPGGWDEWIRPSRVGGAGRRRG